MMYYHVVKWQRAAVALIVVWVLVTYIVLSPLRCSSNVEDAAALQERLKTVSTELESVRRQHDHLIRQIKKSELSGIDLKDIDPKILVAGQGASQDYESFRRRIYSNTKELWYYISSELSKLRDRASTPDQLQKILDNVAERNRYLLSDQERLEEVDGYHEWRRQEAANVSSLVQRRLRYLQNPQDCQRARKVVCNLNKGCGFGCQLHHIIYCLIFAYANERTLILDSKGWRYNPNGWDYVFEPLSETCTSLYEDKPKPWPVSTDVKVISLPFVDSLFKKPKFLPLSVPQDLINRIVRFNGDPSSWWIGQMLKYILKPRPSMQKAINESIAKMKFTRPIVGVHIRRTDKVGTEAAFHHIKEYMAHVKRYYDKLELTQKVYVRRVYLATDDANVLEDARKSYPDYEFLGDSSIAKTAATSRRYTPVSLTGLLVDLHMLSMCDYIVCTFSSQVGRVAYEMMQANRVDASDSFYSLDDIYYFGGQNAHNRLAIAAHLPDNDKEISFQVDDLIGVAGNHWDGYGQGSNRKTNENGLFPWFKTADHIEAYPFPVYKEVPIHEENKV